MTVIKVTLVFERTVVDSKEEKEVKANFNTDDVLMMFHSIGQNTLTFPSAFRPKLKFAEIESFEQKPKQNESLIGIR